MLFVSKICIHTSLRLEVEILWHIVHFTTHLQFYIYSNPFQWIFVIHRKDENRLCDSVSIPSLRALSTGSMFIISYICNLAAIILLSWFGVVVVGTLGRINGANGDL